MGSNIKPQPAIVATAWQIESLEKIRLMARGHHDMLKILANQAVEVLGMDRESESFEANAIRNIAIKGSTVDEAIFEIANNRLLEGFDSREEPGIELPDALARIAEYRRGVAS